MDSLPDVEFRLCLCDCPIISKNESVEPPYLTVVHCPTISNISIPYPQYFPSRDGPLENWDANMLWYRQSSNIENWSKKKNVAIFRGHLSHSSFSGYLFDNISAPIQLTSKNWDHWGRGRLLYHKFSNEYLYRKLDVEFPNLKNFDTISKYNVTGKYLNLSQQNEQFKYYLLTNI